MTTTLPKHVAIIMDGNGRWAKQKGRVRVFGHREGALRVREVIEESARLGIPNLTLYAFSEENWSRPTREVQFLMGLLNVYLIKERELLKRNGISLSAIGNVERLPVKTKALLKETIEYLSDGERMKLTLALSYSGKGEIVQAAKSLAEQVEKGLISIDEISEERIASGMADPSLPDIDLLIRTSGEQRISNFMLWHLSYAELYFSPTHWPDFGLDQYHDALSTYVQRDRRFGGIEKQKRTKKFKRSSSISENEVSC